MGLLDRLVSGLRSEVAGPADRKVALCLIAYCRFDYFAQVLESLLEQRVNNRPYSDYFELYVFQDGLKGDESAEDLRGHGQVAELCAQRLGPEALRAMPENIGVARMYDQAEGMVFLEREDPWAAFFEDDMVLQPGYLQALWQLARQAEEEDRVAMFCCSSGFFLGQAEQARRQRELMPMDHNWGFGIKRAAWLQVQPLMQAYLGLLEGGSFMDRPHGRIQAYQAFCGIEPAASSQDYFLSASLTALGYVRVSTCINLGRYIGERGLHFTKAIFQAKGFDKTVLFEGALPDSFVLNEEVIEALWLRQSVLLAQGKAHDPQAFAARLARGEFGLAFFEQTATIDVTDADIVAAYKIFLNRLPEGPEAFAAHRGVAPAKLLVNFLSSREFLTRKEFWPVIVQIAQALVRQAKANEEAEPKK